MFLSLLLVCGADPVPTFQVENRTFVVVNKLPKSDKPQTVPGVAPRPGEPVKVTPGVVINRPFSETTAVTIVPDRSGMEPSTSGVAWSLPNPTNGPATVIRMAPVRVVDRYGRTRTLPQQQCVGFV